LIYVLDASAIVAYIEGEPGESVVGSLLRDPDATCYVHSVNLCEVYYQGIRRYDDETAQNAIELLAADGVIERQDMGRDFWLRVGRLKARGHISLADCFCVVLAQDLEANVLTCDHGEFGPLVPLDIVPITFIR